MIKTPLDDWIAGKVGLLPGTLTREDLACYQLAQLRETVKLVKEKSAFYRLKFAGVNADKIGSFAQFAELPFTFAQDIQNDPHAFVCTSQREIERIVSLQTSGTTGEPKRLFFTKADQELTIDFFDYGMRNLVGPSDRIVILLPWELPGSVGDLLRIALLRMGAYSIPFGPVYNAAEAIATALKHEATAMVGIPTHILSMVRHQSGKQLQGKIKSVLLTTDHVPDTLSQAVEDTWGCKVFNHYGMTEMGLGGGVQCEARSGYHLREADLYFEIVDPETGQALPDGELGEVVFTTLTRKGMPLVRYCTGDLSQFLPEMCPCGSVLRSMDIVKSRVSGKKKLAGKFISIAELDEALFQIAGVINYQCELSKAKGKTLLTMTITTKDLKSNDSVVLLHQRVQQVLQQIPAVAEGLARDQLIVVVNMNHTSLPISKGTVKREIIDNRPEA